MYSTDFVINIGFPLLLLVVTYFIGSAIERKHFTRIRAREYALRRFPAITLEHPPEDWEIEEVGLVTGSVVISIDHFKRFLSALRGLVGGRVKSYETLLDRARREALLRLKESAREAGYRAVINVRLETSRLANGRRNGKGTAGVEVLAFGTGLALRRAP